MSSGKTADALIAGDVFETLEFKVSEEMNESYLQAEEDFSDRYVGSVVDRLPLVHPGLLINFSNHTRSPSFKLPPGVAAVHAREVVEFLGSARVGDKLTVQWHVTDTFERRSRPFQVVEAVIVSPTGPAIRRLSTYTYMGGPYPGASGESK